MRLVLRLYIAGSGPNSRRAVANVQAICLEHFKDDCQIEIVDLLKHPARALEDNVVVTPTLVKVRPLPMQRAVGNLSDTEQVLTMLGRA